jgi:hypothetical protein
MLGIIGKFFQNTKSGNGDDQINNNSGFRIVTQGYQVIPGDHVQPPVPRGGSSARRPAPNIVYYPVFIDPQNK